MRFYTGDPLSIGNQVGPMLTLDLPIGCSVARNVNLTGLGGAREVFVVVDANAAIDEYDETNNTTSIRVSNQPLISVNEISNES